MKEMADQVEKLGHSPTLEHWHAIELTTRKKVER
jgi:hypothetical protein